MTTKKVQLNNDLEVAHPCSGSLFTIPWSNWNLELGNVDFWGEGETGVPREKPLGAKEKLNPQMALTLGFEPGPQWWEASALTNAPPLLFEH